MPGDDSRSVVDNKVCAAPIILPQAALSATARHRRKSMNRPQQGFPPILDHRGPPRVRRFDEQRWLIDNIICANGIDWDQPRSLYIHLPCGIEANADFAGIRERVKKMADIGPAFAAVARRREAKANAAAQADRKVTARDNFFMAAVHWGAAQWPYDENDETNVGYNNKKRECYAKYAALADWIAARPELDAARIGVAGTSFGSLFGTVLTGNEPRIKACAVMSVCHEPGGETIFQEASPTFKKRFMYMCGITDEDEFDAFRKTITWEGHADKIRVPYLCVAGEAEELSPLEHSKRLMAALKGPKQMVVYQESRHSVGNVPAANLGPFPPILLADWLADRLAGKPFVSEHWYVAGSGETTKTPY